MPLKGLRMSQKGLRLPQEGLRMLLETTSLRLFTPFAIRRETIRVSRGTKQRSLGYEWIGLN